MTDSGSSVDTTIDLELNSGSPLADPLLDSLYRRMRTMHSLYYQAVDTMELEHVDALTRSFVSRARAWCGGRVVSALEGGYAPDRLGAASVTHLRALL